MALSELAPSNVLRAALTVLHIAGYTTRNWTGATGSASTLQINQCWEALHPIPEVIIHWRPDAEAFLRLLLAEHDAHPWAEVQLLPVFEKVLNGAAT